MSGVKVWHVVAVLVFAAAFTLAGFELSTIAHDCPIERTC